MGSRTPSNAVSPGIWLAAVHSVHCYPSGFHKDLAAREPHPLGARSRKRKSRVMPGRHPGLSQGGTAKSGSRARSWRTEGLPNQTGSKFPERVGGQESAGQGTGRRRECRGRNWRSAGRTHPVQTPRLPPRKRCALLPEPEGPAATTRDNLTSQRVPTSDSVGKPEITSPLGAGPCGRRLRRKQGVPPPRAPARKYAQGAGATCPGGAGPGSGAGLGSGAGRGTVSLGGAVW